MDGKRDEPGKVIGCIIEKYNSFQNSYFLEEGKRFALFAVDRMADLCQGHAQFAFTTTKGYMVYASVKISAVCN